MDGAWIEPATHCWQSIATCPLSPRANALSFFSAGLLHVVGGTAVDEVRQTIQVEVLPGARGAADLLSERSAVEPRRLTDGAVYDLNSDSWIEFSPPRELSSAVTVSASSDGVVMFDQRGRAALWQTKSARVEPLPSLPNGQERIRSLLSVVRLGHRVALLSTGDLNGLEQSLDAAVLDVRRRRWLCLPETPLGARWQFGATSTRAGDLVLWGGVSPAGYHSDGTRLVFN